MIPGELLTTPGWLVAALAGPLAAGAVAKLRTPADRLPWPIERGPLRGPHGPRIVAAAELATAVLAATLPVRPAALLVALAYLTLTVVVYRLRGQTCACFGSAAMVGRWHIAANLTAGLLSAAAASLVPPDRLSAPWRLAVTAAAAVLTVIVVRTLERRAATTAGSADCDRPPAMVELVVSDTCPSCRSLKQLLAQMEPARRNAVVTVVVNRGEKLPYGMTSVPAAQALDVDGRPICAPVDGIGAVKALIDTIRLGSPVGGHADR